MDSEVSLGPDEEKNLEGEAEVEQENAEDNIEEQNVPDPTESPLFVEQEVKPEEKDNENVEVQDNTFPLTGYGSPMNEDTESQDGSKKPDVEIGGLFTGVPQVTSMKSIKLKKKRPKQKSKSHKQPKESKLPPLSQPPETTSQPTDIQTKIEVEIGKRTRSVLVEQMRQKKSEELQKKIEEKEQKTRETLYNNSAANYQRACEKCIAAQQKALLVANRRTLAMREFQMQCYSKLQKNDEAEMRKQEIQNQRVHKIQERAADRWLKQHIATQVAQQIERRKESAARQKVRRENERLEKIEKENAEKRQREMEEKKVINDAIMKMTTSSRL